MGQNGSFKILGKSAKTGTSSDGVDLTKITFTSDFVGETKANDPWNSIVQKHWSSLEKSDINRTHGERPMVPRYTHDERKLWPPRNVTEISSNGQNDEEKANKEYYETKIASLKSEVQQLRAEKERLMASTTKPLGESQELSKIYQERMQILEVEVQQLKEEKHKLFTRLSEIGAVQLTENNPNIADLSDDNRPDKLAERISELYDNEWTDAFEYLTQIEGLPDEETVRELLNILQTIYTVCMEFTKKQADDLKNAMLSYLGFPEERKDDFTIKETLKRLRESRATEAETTLGHIIKDAKHQLNDLLEGRDSGILDKYIQKCTHACWFMCIKDPQMYLDFEGYQKNGPPGDHANDFPLYFDTNQFVSFTREGMYVEYVVWPAVYLYKNGPIVKRGVAQGLNREPEANESIVEKKGVNSNGNGDTINTEASQGYNGDNDIPINKDENGDGSHDHLCMDDMAKETVKENAHNLNSPYVNERDDLFDADQEYNGDSPNSDISKEREDGEVSHDPLCTDVTAHETGKENAQTLNSPYVNERDELVDADQGYNGDSPNSGIPKTKDEVGDICRSYHCTDNMAQETDEEHDQNLNYPGFNEHDDLSDAEDNDVSNKNTTFTSSDVRLTLGTKGSTEYENIRCQDELHTEKPIFGIDINIEKGVFAGSKEQKTEMKTNGNRAGLYTKNKMKKKTC